MFFRLRAVVKNVNAIKPTRCVVVSLSRSYAARPVEVPSASTVRQQFLDYFVDRHRHRFIRSSAVVPFSDATIAFVNAGMNQFKNVFLGTADRPCPRAVNAQKCVRVGGKHNDLSVVGTDSYHHTFFEMLGNWSFGDYFKREACEMAWILLKDVYRIDPGRMYVTYFGGDRQLGLPADEECREIWLSLGVPRDRVLPFGASDNFWEMGSSGPCGPCTEIHVDHSERFGDTVSRSRLVNAGAPDLTEIWNIVFIQYNRTLEDGRIRDLPQRHVDTGMGFERLVAHLQGKQSNYDTDIFTPIFQRIHQITGKDEYRGCFESKSSRYELDTGYRILADHSRMITACLADGMFPSQNHKLRRIIRKSLSVAGRTFGQQKLLEDTIPAVVEVLGATYPEMATNLPSILHIVRHEEESYRKLQSSLSNDVQEMLQMYQQLDESDVIDHPGLPQALKEMQKLKQQQSSAVAQLDGPFIHKLYDTYGMDEDLLVKVGAMFNVTLDLPDYERYSRSLKEGFKHELAAKFESQLSSLQGLEQSIRGASLAPTRNEYKYNYAYNAEKAIYEVAPCKTRVTLVIEAADAERKYHVVTEKSNFYYESGGQQGDRGVMVYAGDDSRGGEISSVMNYRGFVIHTLQQSSDAALAVGDEVVLQVDTVRRSANILHHTATHLLNAAVRKVVPVPMCQNSSSVTDKGLRLELTICDEKITPEMVATIEDTVREAIHSNESVQVIVTDANHVDLERVTTVPGEIYPEQGIRVVSIGHGDSAVSVELCCGTHALNVGELEDFVITNVTQSKNDCFKFHAIAGKAARRAHTLAQQLTNDVRQLQQDAEQQQIEDLNIIETRMQRLKNVLLIGSENDINLPYTVRQRCLNIINELYRKLRDRSRESLRELIDIEMRNVMEQKPSTNCPYIVHFLESSIILEEVQLSKATKHCPDRPILVISITDDRVKARATVPAKFVNGSFNAESWLKVVANVFKTQAAAPRGQSASEVCNMKSRKVKTLQFESMLESALKDANQFAQRHLQ